MNQLFYNFMADYKTKTGADMHQCFQMPTIFAENGEEAAQLLIEQLIQRGYTPIVIVEVSGNLSMIDLQNIQDGKAPLSDFKIKKIAEI